MKNGGIKNILVWALTSIMVLCCFCAIACTSDNGHTHSYTSTIVYPTCNENGYTKNTCSCGDSYNDSEVDKLGHDMTMWTETIAPTNTTKGKETRTCKRENCDYSETRDIPPLSGHTHDFNKQVASSDYLKDGATCSTKATYYYSCSCGMAGTETFSYGDYQHSFSKDYVQSEAQHWNKCQNCEQTTGHAPHSYTNGKCVCGRSQAKLYQRVNVDGTPNSKGNYITFGSYPQTLVTDNSIIQALGSYESNTWTSYRYYLNNYKSDYMQYTDKTYNGEKYRGVYFSMYRSSYGYNSGNATSSEQDENGYFTENVYWFKYEPLIWRMLSSNDGKVMLLCESIIDGMEWAMTEGVYHTFYYNNENSVRTWLNDTFYNTAFSETEKGIIQTTLVDNSEKSTNPFGQSTLFNKGVNAYVCDNTNDKVFLPSIEEVTNSALGFNSDYRWEDRSRQKRSTDYAKCQGVQVSSGTGYDEDFIDKGFSYWLLRSPGHLGDGTSYACIVGTNGSLNGDTYDYRENKWISLPSLSYANYNDHGVAPAIYISSNETITPASTNKAYERFNDDDQADSYGRYVIFGSYPQTKVTDQNCISSLNAKAGTLPTTDNSQNWTSYGYYMSGNKSNYIWYIDVELENGSGSTDKYRGVYFTEYRPGDCDAYTLPNMDTTLQALYGYSIGNVYWFKYEPLKWRILNLNSTNEDCDYTGKALLLCESILDAQQFDFESGGYNNSYMDSTIRAWLNEEFYNTAFTDAQKQIILQTLVDNSAKSTNPSNNPNYNNQGVNEFACENTNDKVFLISSEQITNPDYDFTTDPTQNGYNKRRAPTDYAKCQGIAPSNNYYLSWWTRSPYFELSNSANIVKEDGKLGFQSTKTSIIGVVPALYINLR